MLVKFHSVLDRKMRRSREIHTLGSVVLGLVSESGLVAGESDKLLQGLHLVTGILCLFGCIDTSTSRNEGCVGCHGVQLSGSG